MKAEDGVMGSSCATPHSNFCLCQAQLWHQPALSCSPVAAARVLEQICVDWQMAGGAPRSIPALQYGTGIAPASQSGTGSIPAPQSGTGSVPAPPSGTGIAPVPQSGMGSVPTLQSSTGIAPVPESSTGSVLAPRSGTGTGSSHSLHCSHHYRMCFHSIRFPL